MIRQMLETAANMMISAAIVLCAAGMLTLLLICIADLFYWRGQ